MIEEKLHEKNSFVTLTYSEENLPVMQEFPHLPTLKPRDLTLFLKRLRKEILPSQIRFFAVGEYGDSSWRPHYHLALFNFPSCLRGRTRLDRHHNGRSCCHYCDMVLRCWHVEGKPGNPLGGIQLGDLGPGSAEYVAGYTTKKMTGKSDERLLGRHPEFARMSNRPGIGAHGIDAVGDELLRLDVLQAEVDVPSTLRFGSRQRPIGRYLQKRLRRRVGRDEKAPQSVISKMDAQMLPMRMAARADKEDPSLKNKVLEATQTQRLRSVAMSKIRKQKRDL